MKHALPGFLLLLLAMLFAGQYAPVERQRFPDLTASERRIVREAIQKHGYFTVHRTEDGLWMRRDGSIIWLTGRR
jgi:hypothetical protein